MADTMESRETPASFRELNPPISTRRFSASWESRCPRLIRKVRRCLGPPRLHFYTLLVGQAPSPAASGRHFFFSASAFRPRFQQEHRITTLPSSLSCVNGRAQSSTLISVLANFQPAAARTRHIKSPYQTRVRCGLRILRSHPAGMPARPHPGRRHASFRNHRGNRGLHRRQGPGFARLQRPPHFSQRVPVRPAGHCLCLLHLRHALLHERRLRHEGRARRRAATST